MSLFSSLNLARLSLLAHQSAIQTVGQNIANATTEGYARQRVEMRPTPSDDLVYARLGTGVTVARIERIVDEHLEGTLRSSRSDLAFYAEKDRIYTLVGSVFNDLDAGGLSVSLGRFFDALEDLSNTPEDPTARFQLVEVGRTLAETFQLLDAEVRDMRRAFDEDIVGAVQEINRLSREIADLNEQIVLTEGGGVHHQTANDLRTTRDALLGRLSDLVSIKVIENSRGAVQVIAGSDVLVYDSRARTLELTQKSDGDIPYHEFRFTDDGKQLAPRGGRLAALLVGRDEIMPALRQDLDTIAQGFLDEMNALHVTGEGLERFTSVRSAYRVTNVGESLTGAGLPFAMESGRLTLQVVNEADGSRKSYFIPVDLDGTPSDTTLTSFVASINSLVGADHPEISAQITADGYLEIQSSDASLTFTFREDTSGLLRAAGLNVLFTGTNARSIEVSSHLIDNPLLVSTGRGDGPGDNSAVKDMLRLRDEGVLGPSSTTFEQFYSAMIGEIGVQGAEARDFFNNQQAITRTVRNQREALSGVSIDEEAIQLIQYQRAYQASARFLSVVDRLLETLINSV